MATLLKLNLIKHINHFENFKNLHKLILKECCYSSYGPSNIRRTKSLREKTYLVKDNIPNNYTIIYRAPMENYLSLSKNITTFTASFIALIAGYKFATDANFIQSSHKISVGHLVSNDSDLIYFSIGFILINLVLRVVISKYPLRIYKNDKKYIAIFEGQIPFRRSRFDFDKGDVVEHSGLFFNPWKDSMYKIRNSSSILMYDYFKTPSELHQMLK